MCIDAKETTYEWVWGPLIISILSLSIFSFTTPPDVNIPLNIVLPFFAGGIILNLSYYRIIILQERLLSFAELVQ